MFFCFVFFIAKFTLLLLSEKTLIMTLHADNLDSDKYNFILLLINICFKIQDIAT